MTNLALVTNNLAGYSTVDLQAEISRRRSDALNGAYDIAAALVGSLETIGADKGERPGITDACKKFAEQITSGLETIRAIDGRAS